MIRSTSQPRSTRLSVRLTLAMELDLFEFLDQRLETRMTAEWIEIPVVIHPALLLQAAVDGSFKVIDGFIRVAGERPDAGDVVQDERFIGIHGQREVCPFQGFLDFPQSGQRVGSHVNRAHVIG